MILQRSRMGFEGKPTLGELTSRDQKFICVTLERPADDIAHPCIPQGVYEVTIDTHHPGTPGAYRCPELLNVPGRSQIQIHILNRVEESLGCIGPGERVAADRMSIEESGKAFRRLMAYLDGATLPFTLEVRDP